jgi:hypothetical protein
MKTRQKVMLGWAVGLGAAVAAGTAHGIDNSSIGKAEFREHKATYGLVYRLPKDVTDVLGARINGPLREKLLMLDLKTEADTFNIPHVTVVHVHSADPATPRKMLDALPKVPAVLKITLKDFYTTEASKGAGRPWWLDLGIVKSGQSFEDMMTYNTVATAALTPLRDGPLPRCTGPVYANMSDAAKELTRTMGVSGVNVVKDGKEVRAHNPHNTLVYSMTMFTPALQASMKQVADDFNKVLPEGINTSFKDVSIVEIGFAGNVLREIYRISLEDGSVIEVAAGRAMPGMKKQ